MFTSLLLSGALSAALLPTARADEAAADSCVKTKVLEGYNSGFAVRTIASSSLGQSEYKVYVVTLYAGTEYRILACGDTEVADADLIVYDTLGNIVLRDMSQDREPSLSFTPTATDTYYLWLSPAKLNNQTGKGAVTMALTYK